jgi:hypothetical protein
VNGAMVCSAVSVRFLYTSVAHPMFVTRSTRSSMTIASRVLTTPSNHKIAVIYRDQHHKATPPFVSVADTRA